MHHPDIYDLVSIIEDYFILADDEFRCQIEPVICHTPLDPDFPDENIKECQGLKIVRQLIHGKIEVNISGLDKDSNAIKIQYFTDQESQQPIEIIELGGYSSGYKYNSDFTRLAIKEIMVCDRDLSFQQQ
jgi:hypothetical protein